MSDYSTDLDEVLAEISEVPVTTDPIDEETTDPELFEEIQSYYPMLPHADRSLIQRLEKLSRRFPEEAKIRNHISAAYQYMGKHKKANAVARATFRDFPDYLFARINETGFLLDEGRTAEALELLGPRLRLRDLYPDTEVFHLSELCGYYHAVGEYHLHEGRAELAGGIAQYLLDKHSEPHAGLENLLRKVRYETMQKTIERLTEDRVHMISVREKKEKKNRSAALPDLQHPQLEILYRSGYDLDQETLEGLLALPRATLVEDLEVILQDCLERTAYFRGLSRRSGNEDKLFGAIHALFMLGELGAKESLSVILEALSAPGETLDFWFGEEAEEDLWQPVYQVAGDELEMIQSWLLSPGRSWLARNLVLEAISQIVFLEPEREEEIFAWLGGVSEALLEIGEEANVYDTRVAQKLVCLFLDFCRREHHGLIVEFGKRPDFQRSLFGDLAEVEEELLADPPTIRASARSYLGIVERYQEARAQPVPSDSPPRPEHSGASLADLVTDPPRPPLHSNSATAALKSVGRNDPCPCGSGKKYKKCCL